MRVPKPRVPATKRGRIALAVASVPLLAGLIALVVLQVSALPSDAAFRADGVVVTKAVLEHRTKMLGSLYGISAPSGAQQQDEFRRDAARLIARTVVIDNAAAERHIEISDPIAQEGLDKLIHGLNPPNEDGFVRLLADTGASKQDVLDEIKRQDRSAAVADQITQPAVQRLTEVDYQNYYRQNPAEQTTPEQRHLRNIVLNTEPEAAQVAAKLHSGADFGSLAQESSLDDATRNQAGDLGFVTRDRLDPDYGNAAFGSLAGSIFGPVHTGSGWNVGQVVEVRPAAPRTYGQARDEIVHLVRTRAAAQAWATWLSGRLAAADITYAAGFQPPAAVPSAPPPPRSIGAGIPAGR